MKSIEILNKYLFSAIESYNKLEEVIKLNSPTVIIKCFINDSQIKSLYIHQYLHKNSSFYKNDITLLLDEAKISFGICTLKQLIKIFKLRSNIKTTNCNKIHKYIEEYKKLHPGKTEPYIHISPKPINLTDFIKSTGSWFKDPLFVNPNGLWFSIGAKWADRFSLCNEDLYIPKNTNDILDDIKYNYSYDINNNWLLPINVYVVELDTSVHIKIISTCAELHAFESKYKRKNPQSIAEALDWEKITHDWDGLILYPWKGMQCIPYYNKIKTSTKNRKILMKSSMTKKYKKMTNKLINRDAEYYNSYPEIISDALLGKIKLDDFISIWQRGWDEDSGVIWRNFNKIKLHSIV